MNQDMMSTVHTSVDAWQVLERLCAGVDDPRPAPATVFVVAHPDDEVLGAGNRLPRLRQALFVHVTDGSPRDQADAAAQGFGTREAYADARRQEYDRAVGLAGIGAEQTRELNIVDQEASLHLAELSRRLAALLDELRPEAVITHPYEGGHPDHDATAFAVHAAIAMTDRDGGHPPVLVEMTSYHNSRSGIETGVFLPDPGGGKERVVALSEAERELKRQMLAQFATQQGTIEYFSVDVERFRLAPRYDFTAPPHGGMLFYEQYAWGMTGERFRQLSHEAMDALGLTGPI